MRHVVHYAYPAKGADPALRALMIDELRSRGLSVSDAAAKGGLVLEQHRSVAPEDFDSLTAELSKWFAGRGWEYDGWECAVVKPEPDPS